MAGQGILSVATANARVATATGTISRAMGGTTTAIMAILGT